jgi:hypothetical protein
MIYQTAANFILNITSYFVLALDRLDVLATTMDLTGFYNTIEASSPFAGI